MSNYKIWWIDDVEESVCARIDHPKRGLDTMPWPDCDRVHIVMLVSDHEKEITALKQQLQEREELIKELIDTFDLFDEVPLPFKIVNKMESVVKKARKLTEGDE